jgi:hypothetical protein
MLTEQKRRFAYQVIAHGDKLKAADFIGIDEATADEWLADPEVQAAIEHDRAAAIAVAGENRESVVARSINWANVDPGDYFETIGPDGEPLPGALGWSILKGPAQLTTAQRRCIKKIKWSQHGPEIEFYDAMRANRDVAEFLGVLDSGHEDTRPEDWASALRELADDMEKVTSGAD